MQQLSGLRSSINEISKEKNIDKKSVISSLEQAYKTFAKKKIDMVANMEAEYDEEADLMTIYKYSKVVENVRNSSLEISLKEARVLDPDIELEDELGIDVSSQLSFSRNDIMLIRQLFINSVQREIKERLVSEFSNRKGNIVSGIIKKIDYNYYLVDLGSTEAYLSKKDCINEESFKVGDKIQAVLTQVDSSPRGAELHLSRTTPLFVLRLLEQEVPEIEDGLIEVTKIAREAGFRTKILLKANETSLNPIQIAVGNKGFRIQNVVSSLQGERVNVYLDKSFDFAAQLEELTKEMTIEQSIILPEKVILVTESENLGKIVGAKGTNLKATASILGRVVDVVSVEKYKQYQELACNELRKFVSDLTAQTMVNRHLTSLDRIKGHGSSGLSKDLGLSLEEAETLIKAIEQSGLKVELKADAFAHPKNFYLPEKSKSNSMDAERRLREEIRSNLNIRNR